MKRAAYTLFAGIIAGAFLGLLLKLAQQMTGYKVYTLLLNIDYIPVLSTLHLSEWGEFILHLIVAVILAFILSEIAVRRRMMGVSLIRLCISVNIVIAICYYPLTNLSDNTPLLISLPAFLIWIGAHFFYGLVLGFFLSIMAKNKS